MMPEALQAHRNWGDRPRAMSVEEYERLNPLFRAA